MADTVDFEAFCVRQNASLIRMLTLYCGDREVARDLAQETLARAWVHWHKVRSMDRADLWVRRVALNLANSHFRHTRVERDARTQMLTADMRVDGHDEADRLVVRAALAQLTQRQRESILLRYLEDLSVEQTAALMGCSVGVVKKLTARALASLRECIGADFEVPHDA